MKIFAHRNLNRIDVLDERFYTEDSVTFYPSVTTVLGVYPKGYGYEQWLKNTKDPEALAEEARDQGSNIHNAIEQWLNGQPLEWIRDDGKANYTLGEWQQITRFMEFYNEYIDPADQVAVETPLFSTFLKLGGTADLVCKINGETWLIDFKTGNGLYKTNEIQLAVYKTMWDEKNRPEIDRYGILWLNSGHRTKKQFQGLGWQLKELSQNYLHDMKLYGHLRAIWDEENPEYRPKNMSFPNEYPAISRDRVA